MMIHILLLYPLAIDPSMLLQKPQTVFSHQYFCFPPPNHFLTYAVSPLSLTEPATSAHSSNNNIFISAQGDIPQIKGRIVIIFKFRQLKMNFAYFPLRQFTQALTVTSKVKSRLQPFIQEMKSYNMQWLFQTLIELYQYMTSTDCKICYKFNSLVALKILLDTCEFPIIMLVEVYFLPHIRKIATYQLHSIQKQRGIDYFLVQGFSKVDDIKKLGYNYVRLASEIVTIMAQVKPFRLYGTLELAEPSQFTNVLEIMRAHQWKQYDHYAFYPEEQNKMRETFLIKTQNMVDNSLKYYQFLQAYLDKMIRKQYTPKIMDLRKIFQSGEVLACNYVLDCLKEMLKEYKVSIKTKVIRMMTEFVKWGYIKAYYIIECQNVFEDLFNLVKKSYSLKNTQRGRYYFKEYEGTQQERRQLYHELIRSLQIWAICIPTNPMKQDRQSKCSLIYKEFLQQYRLEFPYLGDFKKIRNQCEQSLQKNKEINRLIMKDLKKNDFDIVQMRRSSSNLEELMKLDQNLSCSIKALIRGVEKYKTASSQGSYVSSSQQSSWTNTEVRLQGTFKSIKTSDSDHSTHYDEQIEDSNKQSRCLNGFTTKGKKQVSLHSIKLSHVIQIKQLENNAVNSIPQLDSDSDEENYTVQCEQNLRINGLRCIVKQASKDNADKEIKIKIYQAKRHHKVEFFVPNGHLNKQGESFNQAEIKKARQIFATTGHCGAKEEKYSQFVNKISQINHHQLLSNKDLLLKTNKIQIGFISKLISDYSIQLVIFITPFKDIENLRWNILADSTVSFNQQTQRFNHISENNQRKIVFQFSINVPYQLPRLLLQYQMENKHYQHILFLPISFNNFITFSENLQQFDDSSILEAPSAEISPSFSQPSAFLSYFSDFTYNMLDNKSTLFYCKAQYLSTFFNIYLLIQDKKFLHIKCQIPAEKKHLVVPVEFLMAVLLSILQR